MKSTNKKDVEAQLVKFKNGTIWKLTKVVFLDGKTQYISSPCKKVIDLRITMVVPVLQALLPLSAWPAPPATIADMLQIRQGLRFDAMGVISCIKQREGVLTKGGPRTVVDVDLSGGSKIGDNVASRRFAIWLPPWGASLC